jgi:hypothetical protein
METLIDTSKSVREPESSLRPARTWPFEEERQ